MQTRRERSEGSEAEVPPITASAGSFFFHPVTQIYVFTLLLSSFTHTRVYARAYARESAREGGVGKEVKKSRHSPRGRHVWPTLATSPRLGPVRRPFPTTRHVATRWPTRRLPNWRTERPVAGRPIGTSRRKSSGEARGNSHHLQQSLFSLSERPKEKVHVGIAATRPPALLERSGHPRHPRS